MEKNVAFIHQCLVLASQGRGNVGNGALVGAVLVRGNRRIAEAFHASYGGPHAERTLLEAYADPIQPADILYVNLEPCCHQGKTPACTDILVQRGVKNVVFGMLDPDHRVSGKGLDVLQAAGIRVTGPVERSACEYLNKGFINVRQKQRPWITVKMAKDRAGRISEIGGKPLKITSPEQDAWSHQFLRARHDAILCGIETIETDNPQLNIRFDQNTVLDLTEGLNGNLKYKKNFTEPYKIILDASLRMSPEANVATQHPEQLILCVGEQAAVGKKAQLLRDRGVRVCPLPMKDSLFAWRALWNVLTEPHGDFHGITSVLVEGGQRTWDAFRAAGMVDEEVILIGGGS